VGRAQGSGVIVSEDGYVLTAAHVAGAPNRRVRVILPDGREVVGKSLGMNQGVDAGLIKITDAGKWPHVEMGEIDTVDAGDWCVATGHPGGYREGRSPVLRLGRVIMVRDSVIQTDCTLVGGDSGGPLFDMDGRVIGINSRIGTSTNWNFHVPISSYRDDWDRLVAGEEFGTEEVSVAVLGVSGDDHPDGCKVTDVARGYPAEQAGIQVGDIIMSIDGRKIRGFDGLAQRVRQRKPGDEVTLQVVRDGEPREISAVLAQRE
jgi:serine protease Do